VTVTSPQTAVVLTAGRGGVAAAPRRLTSDERARAERIRRAQLRIAVVTLLGGALLLVGLPVLLDALPVLLTMRLYDVPVAWLAVGVLPYPALALLGRRQLRRAEEAERPDATASSPRDAAQGAAATASSPRDAVGGDV
jgi:O-antigen/teichoic acid export membrane protein